MLFVPTDLAIQEVDFANGQSARACHPNTLDLQQTYLIAGYSWGMIGPRCEIFTSPIRIPILLRPWCGALALAIRACLQDAAGTVEITLEEDDGMGGAVEISDMVVTLTQADLTQLAPAPATETAWMGIPVYGCGALGYTAPPAAGKGALTFAPANEWRYCYLVITLTGAAIHDLSIRAYPSSPTEITP
jgi:hypothetical protein